MTTPIRLDVGGQTVHVTWTTIERHPQTLLGQLVANENTAEYQCIQQDLSVTHVHQGRQ